MQIINDQIPATGALPENYQEVLSWKVTGKPIRVIALNVFGVTLFVIFGMVFSSITIRVGKLPFYSQGKIERTRANHRYRLS